MPLMSKERREVYSRKVGSFWKDFSHNRIGFVGLVIILFYLVVAVFAPWLSPYPPINSPRVSIGFAFPSWMTMFPEYSNLPPTITLPLNWTPSQPYADIDILYGDRWNLSYRYVNGTIGDFSTYLFTSEFNYTYSQPQEFEFVVHWDADFSDVAYRMEFNITNPSGETYPLLGTDYILATDRVGVLDSAWNLTYGNWQTTSGEVGISRRMLYEQYYAQFYKYYFDQRMNATGGYEKLYNNTIYNQLGIQALLWNQTLAKRNNVNYTDALWSGFDTYFNQYWFGNETWSGWNQTVANTPNVLGKKNVLKTHYENQLLYSWNETYGTVKNMTLGDPRFNQTWWEPYYNGNATWTGFWNTFGDAMWDKAKVDYLALADNYADPKAKADADQAARSIIPTDLIFSSKGEYVLTMYLIVKPTSQNAHLNISYESQDRFRIWGSVHGVLGGDAFGHDVLTQLLHGARISLIVGFLAAVLATSLEIIFGVASGYLGGFVDELTMRVVDVMLCLPTLPLLLALASYFRPNVYFIVLIIAVFGWQGGARVIRSRVLTVREMPFVESAKASGASDSYLIFKHLIPNIFPIAIASMILAVPAAILTEAAISFLGFGDPLAPTWGKMLHEAQVSGAFGRLAWFYVLPPGIAITVLCVAFVFLGHALDEIVNPRLRRRR